MFLGRDQEEDGGVEASRGVARHADDLVRRCSLGLPGADFQAEVVRAIHALLPVDAVFLATADPETLLLTGVFAEEPLANVADQFLNNEFGQDDVNKFQSLATGPRHVATLDSATRGDRVDSARYRQIMAPLPRSSPPPDVGVTFACIGPRRRTGSLRPRSALSAA
jgi:hypothetical protein